MAVAQVTPGCLPDYPTKMYYPAGWEPYFEDVHLCRNHDGIMIVRNLTSQVWVFETGITVRYLDAWTRSEEFFIEARPKTAIVMPGHAVIPSSQEIRWAPDVALTLAWKGQEIVVTRAESAAKTALFALLAKPGNKTATAMKTCSTSVEASVRTHNAGEPTDPKDVSKIMSDALTYTGGGAACAAAIADMDKEIKADSKRAKFGRWSKTVEKTTNRASTHMFIQDLTEASWRFCGHTTVKFKGFGC